MDEAMKKATELLGKITKKEEKTDCFIFYNEEKEYDGVLVVMKNTLKVLSMTEYVMRTRR